MKRSIPQVRTEEHFSYKQWCMAQSNFASFVTKLCPSKQPRLMNNTVKLTVLDMSKGLTDAFSETFFMFQETVCFLLKLMTYNTILDLASFPVGWDLGVSKTGPSRAGALPSI